MESQLLLTGSTGAIGRRLLPSLLATGASRRVTVLVRDPDQALKHPGVDVLVGDLRSPKLGLDGTTWGSLADSITDVVHCAADTRFTQSIEDARAVNTIGTRTLLGLARQAKRLRRFAHVSTTFVMGRDSGELPERQYVNRGGFVNTYEQSKYEAECEVFAAMPEIPIGVFRLSSVAGQQSTYFERAVRMIPRNPFATIPAGRDCRIDLISEAWAVAALAELFERHFSAGRVYNICAGPAASIPVGVLLESAFAAMGVQRLPTMVGLEDFERFAAKFLSNGHREPVKELLRSVSTFLPHLAIDQRFQNAATLELLKGGNTAPCDSFGVLREMLVRLNGHAGTIEPAARATLLPSTEVAV